MTDEPIQPQPPTSNGRGSDAARASVRSGLAKKRNPALVTIGDFASATRRFLTRDPLSLFLLLASIGLAITFALLLGSIQPSSSGRQVPLSTVQQLAKRNDIATALLLDHDDRVEVKTTGHTPLLRADGTLPPTPAAVASPHRGKASTGGKVEKVEKRALHPVASPPNAVTAIQPLWASYPSSGAQTQQLTNELLAGGAVLAVDQQSW